LFVLDEHLDVGLVHDPIVRWATARYVRDIRRGEVVKDERILSILPTLRTPTFVTDDDFFWKRAHCNPRYCIVFVALRGRSHGHVPDLLRRLLRLPEFRTRAARMGKVVQLGEDHVRWWQFGDDSEHAVDWEHPPRWRSGR
jgi:hypothetical protein